MIEKIGNVVLDYSYYPGKDLYCDGMVEQELLEIVKSHEESEYNRIIEERKEWPILYHLSHVRENITEWLPINKEASVLEIGSGCGAVTGSLSRKFKNVTCIELSKQRSLINAYRHKDADNIKICLGNFEEVEKHLSEKYDCITLIGVLEYAGLYINSNNPFVDFLAKIEQHLKPNGTIVIAIENRMGLKYWAGCKEDHVGMYFEGLEGYTNTKSARTFTKKELEGIFDEACLKNYRFYYPYPDYKFPLRIYSDKYLPKCGELDDNSCNLDGDRMLLFNDTLVYNEIINNNLFPLFSNSYLIEVKRG